MIKRERKSNEKDWRIFLPPLGLSESCFHDAIRMANNLMDQRVRVNSARQVENKRRRESNQGNNHVQQPPPKRQNVVRAYTVGSNEKGGYVGKAPFCNN
ncbi:hypothetical protein Tco_1231701, partial [Tanacetum coccineum]